MAKGTFSVYSEITVHNGRIDGYVKPLFKDIQVYDPQLRPSDRELLCEPSLTLCYLMVPQITTRKGRASPTHSAFPTAARSHQGGMERSITFSPQPSSSRGSMSWSACSVWPRCAGWVRADTKVSTDTIVQ